MPVMTVEEVAAVPVMEAVAAMAASVAVGAAVALGTVPQVFVARKSRLQSSRSCAIWSSQFLKAVPTPPSMRASKAATSQRRASCRVVLAIARAPRAASSTASAPTVRVRPYALPQWMALCRPPPRLWLRSSAKLCHQPRMLPARHPRFRIRRLISSTRRRVPPVAACSTGVAGTSRSEASRAAHHATYATRAVAALVPGRPHMAAFRRRTRWMPSRHRR